MDLASLWDKEVESLKPASLVVISLAVQESVQFIASDRATQAAAAIRPKKYLVFLGHSPDIVGRKLYLHPVLKCENVESSSAQTLVYLGQDGGVARSLKPSTPLPWSISCAVDASIHCGLSLHHIDCHPVGSENYHFDSVHWDIYRRTIRREIRCLAVEQMKDEMDKYDIPPKDRGLWGAAKSASGPSTSSPPGPFSWVPPIQVDVSLDVDALSNIPDYHEFEKELQELHRIRRLYSRPGYERTLAWVEAQVHDNSNAYGISDEPISNTASYLDFLLDVTRPKGSNASDVMSSSSSGSEDSLLNDDSDITPYEIITVPLPPVNRKKVKVICIDVFRTLIDEESAIYEALRPTLFRTGSNIERRHALSLFTDFEADLQRQDQTLSYPEVLRQAFILLTQQLGIDATTQEEHAFVGSIASWDVFHDCVQAVQRISTQFRLIALANVDKTTYDSIRGRIDPGDVLSGAITITSRFRPDPRSFEDAVAHCEERFNVCPEEILVVGSSLYHDLAPAWEMGVPVAWIRRKGAVVGSEEVEHGYSKRPSAIFSSLLDFAQWITDPLPLDEGQPNSSGIRQLVHITNTHPLSYTASLSCADNAKHAHNIHDPIGCAF